MGWRKQRWNQKTFVEKVEYLGDIYELTTYSNGSEKLYCEKNKYGFKSRIRFSGDKKKNEEAETALNEFIVNYLLWTRAKTELTQNRSQDFLCLGFLSI